MKSKVLSMRWLGNEDSNEIQSVYLLNRASNWTDFRKALRTFVSVNQNAVYADVKGNIGLQSTIGIPFREGDRTLVYPGDTTLYDWKGLVPFEELPYTYNPECGYVASANCKTAPADYPYYISDWYIMPYRMDRIVEMLKEKEKLSIEDFQRMQGDQKSKMAEKFTRYFLSHLSVKPGLSETEKAVYELMGKWDYSMKVERPEALIFEKWYYLTGLILYRIKWILCYWLNLSVRKYCLKTLWKICCSPQAVAGPAISIQKMRLRLSEISLEVHFSKQ